MNIRRWGSCSFIAAALLTTMIEVWPQGREIEISVGNQIRRIESRTYRNQELFRLKDLAEICSLQLRERGSNLTIVGARGEILITDGRPLVRSGDHYVLLSSGAWKRKEGDWYVPEDFLLNALPNIVSQKLEKRSDGSFQLSSLRTNRVRVEMNNYPDHLSVIFEVSQKAPVQVRDFRDYVEVIFANFLVSAEHMASSPDPRLVTSVEFSEQEALGSFRIRKGSQFSSFRQYYLEAPGKLIIEVYGTPSDLLAAPSPATDLPPNQKPATSDPEARPVRTVGIGEVVVIDPGHGGLVIGVDAYQDLLEKVITLSVARRIEKELVRRGLKVRLTRARDVQLPNEQRSAISNFYQCRLYVGIHLGGAPSRSTHGPVVYVYSPSKQPRTNSRKGGSQLVPWDKGQLEFLQPSRRLATSVQGSLNRLFESSNPVVGARLAVLAPVKAPAVLIETGFLTNTDDQNLLATPGFQEKIAKSITNSIIEFLR